MQDRPLKQEADDLFSQWQREPLSRFCQETKQALEDQRESLVTEVTSKVLRRDEQLYDLRTERVLRALHAEHVFNNKIKNMLDYIST